MNSHFHKYPILQKAKIMSDSNLLPVQLPNEIIKYNLLWDLGEGFISTFCPSVKVSNTVFSILKSNSIQAHQMNTDNRIVVIYL
jgi:hypothetical protein